jgi:hypothetical protein
VQNNYLSDEESTLHLHAEGEVSSEPGYARQLDLANLGWDAGAGGHARYLARIRLKTHPSITHLAPTTEQYGSPLSQPTDVEAFRRILTDFDGFRRISTDFDGFRRIPTDFDGFRRAITKHQFFAGFLVPNATDGFRRISTDSDGFRRIPTSPPNSNDGETRPPNFPSTDSDGFRRISTDFDGFRRTIKNIVFLQVFWPQRAPTDFDGFRRISTGPRKSPDGFRRIPTDSDEAKHGDPIPHRRISTDSDGFRRVPTDDHNTSDGLPRGGFEVQGILEDKGVEISRAWACKLLASRMGRGGTSPKATRERRTPILK